MTKKTEPEANVQPADANTLEIAPEIQLREELGRMTAECGYLKNRVLVLAQLNATMAAKLDEFEARLATAGGKAD